MNQDLNTASTQQTQSISRSILQPPADLQAQLQQIVSELSLVKLKLPDLPEDSPIHLWLLSPDMPPLSVHDERVTRLWQNTPYWSFCWASGLAMARLVLNYPELVAGKTVIDFGAGSAVVGIAAKLAGAKRVIACDLDPVSLLAAKHNADLCGVTLDYLSDINELEKPADLLLAADVLYDLCNRSLLDHFLSWAKSSVVADSRVRDFKHSDFTNAGCLESSTWPDLDESAEFRQVNFYASQGFEQWKMSLNKLSQ
jgi:predicted nicotinamide N-methyase